MWAKAKANDYLFNLSRNLTTDHEILASPPTEVAKGAFFSWPEHLPELANVIAPEFIRLGLAQGSSFTSKSREGKMNCQEASGSWDCKFADFLYTDTSINLPKKQNVTVPEGLKDEFGSPLPIRSADYMLDLPSGSIKVSSYRAPDAVLVGFIKEFQEKEQLFLDEDSYAPDCHEGEKLALNFYTAEGYKLINSALRNLARGQKPERRDEIAVLSAISAFNCIGQSKKDFVIRGATLSQEKLAKYQKEATVAEHAFTSTTIDKEVLPDFRGNTEFRIIEARGADLSDFGVMS